MATCSVIQRTVLLVGLLLLLLQSDPWFLQPSSGAARAQMQSFRDQTGADDTDDSTADDNIIQDPNLINPQNKQGYGRNIPDQIMVKSQPQPKSTDKSNVDDRSISEQTEQAILQFGVLVAVSLLVAILFFVNVGIELLFDKIVQKVSDMFGRIKTLDIEEQDPASLVGTFKRYK